MFFKIPSWSVFTHFLRIQALRPFSTGLLRWEWLALIICLAICIYPRLFPAEWFRVFRVWFHNFAQNRRRAIWTCALFPMIVRVPFLPVVPIRPPSVHDEFSLLLMADTFRSGRLTNPTHPYWRHFESIHVIQRPTYNSMYPPGFGAFLAFGQLLGDPWIGILLTVGLMCAALCWMMQAWLPPAWALGGSLVAALQIGIGSYWINSYVGGAPVPAMAGALLFGAVPRFLRKPTWDVASLFAIGVVFLVNTRPFEGTVLSLVCFGLATLWRWRGVFGSARIRWPILLPATSLLALGAVFTSYYQWRVTGNPFKTAYVVNRETYGWPENLAILPPEKITYWHPNLKNMHLLELSRRARYSTFGRMLESWSARSLILWEFYAGPGLTLALLMLPWIIRNRKLQALFFVAALMLCLNSLQLMAYPQHLSPETAIFFVLITTGLRHIYVVARRKGFAPERVIAGIVLCVMCSAALSLFIIQLHIRAESFWEWPHWQFYEARAAISWKLEQMPGKHVVFVHYARDHSAHEEWVYNRADIDNSKVVWANSMGLAQDMELRRYYKDRHAWIVAPDRALSDVLPFTKKIYTEMMEEQAGPSI